MSKNLPLHAPNFNTSEKNYLLKCLKSTWISSSGEYINKFEKKISQITGSKFAVACINGTSAIHTALNICGVKKNDEVIVPSITFISPINAVKYCFAKPIFMDCDKYFNVDKKKIIEFLEKKTFSRGGYCINKITKNKISAIILVHVWGNLVDIYDLIRICKKKNIKVIEDASESLGSYYVKKKFKPKHSGTLGDVGCLSFNGNKIITSGGGGMILTKNKKYYTRARYLITQSKDNSKFYKHNNLGYNYRLSNLHSAIGLAQAKKLKIYLYKKKLIHNNYKRHINKIPGLKILENPKYSKSNNWLNILIVSKEYKKDIKWIEKKLKNNNIESRFVWYPNHLQKHLKKHLRYKINNALHMVNNSICLPSSVNLSEVDIIKISKIINA